MLHRLIARASLIFAAILLAGCAAQNMRGYQNTFQGYDIPQPLLDRVVQKFRQHGLSEAAVGRDSVGRLRLMGSYRNEDDVDAAFTIAQAVVGIKSTSPFYPDDIKEKRWERQAGRGLADLVAARNQAQRAVPQGVRRALVIGINTFAAGNVLRPIQGEDDARAVAAHLERVGYRVTSLFGTQATKSSIEAAVARTSSEVGPDDSLFVYVSSHGNAPLPSYRGGDERKMSIMAYDTGSSAGDYVDKALAFERTAVKDSVFQDLAQRPSRVTRVLIDTCYSGEMLTGVPKDSRDFILSQNGGKVERSSVSLASWTGSGFTSKGIQFAPAPGQAAAGGQAHGAFRSRSGYTLMTATSEGEEAHGPDVGVGTFQMGGKTLRGSFFTQTLLSWLEVHNGQIQPAYEQARAFTADKVSAESKGTKKQTPRIFSTLPAGEDDLRKF
jgi:hypothetical protein